MLPSEFQKDLPLFLCLSLRRCVCQYFFFGLGVGVRNLTDFAGFFCLFFILGLFDLPRLLLWRDWRDCDLERLELLPLPLPFRRLLPLPLALP